MTLLKVRWTGTAPLIMHNGQMADVDNEYAEALKKLTSKKNKTKEDRREMSWIEFQGGLYWNEEIGPFVPADNILACIIEGGRISKLGVKLEQGLSILEMSIPLEYKGPRDPVKMFANGVSPFVHQCMVNGQGGRKGGGKTKRTRPAFMTPWSIAFSLDYKDRVLDKAEVVTAMTDAGDLIGLMDKPRFGKFSVKEISE